MDGWMDGCQKHINRSLDDKRGIKRSTENGNFLGYECKSNGDLATNIKGSFGLISDSPHLHHICAKLGLKLMWEHQEKRSLMDYGNACGIPNVIDLSGDSTVLVFHHIIIIIIHQWVKWHMNK